MIIFEKLRYKNFLSTGNIFNEIVLTDHKMNLISGKNGGGKSTILDALVFSLFGKPFRKIVKGLLINSRNKKEMRVELEMSIGPNKYKIIRGIKPNLFEIYCNDTLIDQEAANNDYQSYIEKELIKCNYKTFTQIVILGSATYVPFMELEPKDRRSVIEDILDIGVFSNMSIPLKSDVDDAKDDLAELKTNISVLETKIKMANEHNEKIKNVKKVDVSVYENDISNNEKEIKELQNYLEKLQNKLNNIDTKEVDINALKSKLKKYMTFNSDVLSSKKKLINERDFLHKNDNCPVCKQHITDTFKTTTCEQHDIDIENIERELPKLMSMIEKTEKSIEEYENNASVVYKLNMEIDNVNRNINQRKSNISNTKKTIENLLQSQQESLDLIDDIVYKNELKVQMDLYNQRFFDMEVMGEISKLLKDGGIKSDIIKKYIPKMNELINEYLIKFDLYVNFTLDENFDETIQSRYIDNFSYTSFSQGEKLRINLAIMLTWKEIAKKKNSISTNLLILDETLDGALDEDGVSDLIKALRNIEGEVNNIFVISHRGDSLKDLFDVHLHFEKQKNFSIMTIKE